MKCEGWGVHLDLAKQDMFLGLYILLILEQHSCPKILSKPNPTHNLPLTNLKGIVHFEIHFWYVLAYLK